MTMRLSERVKKLHPSPTMALDAKTKALIQEGHDVVNFTAGEPDFDTPNHIRMAAAQAIERGETRYTAVGGTVAMKAAAIGRIHDEVGLTYRADEVLVSAGAKHSLFNAVMALVSEGDEVLLPVPYWVTYPEQVQLAGGKSVMVPIQDPTRAYVSRDDLAAQMTPKTRGMILNSPSNPTGAVIPPKELEAIAAWAVANDLWVISDEIYSRLVYEDTVHKSIASYPGMRERTVLINGVSKAYAMTGWRIGYAAAPRELIQAMSNLQSQATSNPSAISQAAAVAALTGPDEPVVEMRREFNRRRIHAVNRIREIPGLTVLEPEGAFYLWVGMSSWIGKTVEGKLIESADDLALVWLEKAGVSVVPGSGFGVDDHFRISYATSTERLESGLDRMQRLLEES